MDGETKICGVVCECGPEHEPLACGFPKGHAGPHAWASLPTWTQRWPHEREDFVRGWSEGWECARLKADGFVPPPSEVREALTFAGFSDELIAAVLSEHPEPQRITHGRHCICSACAAQDWSEPQLAPCGMHGPSCPAVYAPLGGAGALVHNPGARAESRRAPGDG